MIVALSSGEAEFNSAAKGVSQGTVVRNAIRELFGGGSEHEPQCGFHIMWKGCCSAQVPGRLTT